ncbi:MAG: hypothetical protein PHX34_03695 [Candidatus Shapirobacteria bacterium]|nr:hypothetical protein [Candidatus Shapirobacteria bacterium]
MNNIEFLPIFLMVQKIFFIACSIFYLIFALIVVKQVTSMSKNVKDKFNPILISFSYIHLIFAIFLIFIVIAWL